MDLDERACVERWDLVDGEQVLPPGIQLGALAANRIDVVAADQHRAEQPRVVWADPGQVDDEQVTCVHDRARPDGRAAPAVVWSM